MVVSKLESHNCALSLMLANFSQLFFEILSFLELNQNPWLYFFIFLCTKILCNNGLRNIWKNYSHPNVESLIVNVKVAVQFHKKNHAFVIWNYKFRILFQISESDINGLNFFAELSNYHVYTTLNAKNQFRAPTEWGICLRPSGVDTEDETPELKCIACDSERVRSCWLTAMRLAKVGFFFFTFFLTWVWIVCVVYYYAVICKIVVDDWRFWTDAIPNKVFIKMHQGGFYSHASKKFNLEICINQKW